MVSPLLWSKAGVAFMTVSPSQRFIARTAPTKTCLFSNESNLFTSSSKESRTLPINLLSFDGGGIKGALSTRLMAYSLQLILSGHDKLSAEGDSSLGESWRKRLFKYVDSFEPCFDVMWTVWAQQLDSMGIEPQIQPQGEKKWMNFAWENTEHREMIRSILRIDLAYEFYVAHVLAISGTSTGGIIAVATMLRMSLTQLVAMYMDPKICELIFPTGFDIFRPGSKLLLQAKYKQDGVHELTKRVLRWIAPVEGELSNDEPKVKFVEAATTFNECIKARILGDELPLAEQNRLRLTLQSAKNRQAVEGQLARYQSHIKTASQFLDLAKVKRFKLLNSVTNEDKNCLSRLLIMEPSVCYDEEYFSTRFLITSRCVNNGAAVVFDSHEPIKDGMNMTARGALQFRNDVALDVQNMEVKDVILATSAAPSFFPAHEVVLNGVEKIKVFFQDGGVMANDPGLINACIAYQHFTASPMTDTRYFPIFRLFRVGCGKEEAWEDRPFKWHSTQGGLPIVTKLADIFMGSDTRRTNLLASVLSQSYSLQDNKLDCYVPTGKGKAPDLPMDQYTTVKLINALFAKIDPRLAQAIAIPEDQLRVGLAQALNTTSTLSPEENAVLTDLVNNIYQASRFLRRAENGRTKPTNTFDEVLAFLGSVR